MAKEEKPLEYQRRILDTKGVAQRLDLDYLKKPNAFRDWRKRLTWMAPLVTAVGAIPFVAGIGGTEKVFSNGAVSRSHAIFEQNCSVCHTANFSSVADAACKKCHDGPSHPAKSIDTGKPSREVKCSQCHLEHRGTRQLAEVPDGNCTTCHADLKNSGSGVKLAGVEVTRFRQGRHPEFSAGLRTDARPLRLNHAAHMPAKPKTILGIKLPMQCTDCHAGDAASPKVDLLPVTFEQHCRSCHKRELEFDVYQVLGANAVPAPHTKDPRTIHDFIADTYAKAVAADPGLTQRPLGREFTPPGGNAAWIEKVVRDSEDFLFERKCKYCHEYEGQQGGYPVVKKVAPVRGQFLAGKPEGQPWLLRGEFSHRAHRAVDCASCHSAAKTSTKTADVLIPKMADCQVCHGSSGTHLDRCAQCHQYHNKSKELDKDRRPAGQLVGQASGLSGSAVFARPGGAH